MSHVDVQIGNSPIVLGQPHGGTAVPDVLWARLNAKGQELSDTDWHISKLYEGLCDDCTIVAATFHRYVIDANRDPSGTSLYPGQSTTGLCPTTDFDGASIWIQGQEPSEDEIAARRTEYHAQYHLALRSEIERVRARHGVAVLFDCHSIRSVIPRLFEGRLPQNNIGTNGGVTCAPRIEALVERACKSVMPSDTILNGRFRGGWTTRHYGKPSQGIHAIQMETAQRGYMDEVVPWTYRPERAERIRDLLRDILRKLDQIARSGALSEKE